MAWTIEYLGIHDADIEHAGDVFDRVCDSYGIDNDEAWGRAKRYFVAKHGEEFGNEVIRCLFDTLACILVKDHGIDNDSIGYRIDGFDSDFLVGGERAW